jgi:hypothetical protein
VGAEAALTRMRDLADRSTTPWRALWQINSDSALTSPQRRVHGVGQPPQGNSRAELKAYAERVRDIETAAVTMVLRANGVDLAAYPPVAISMLIAQAARSLCNESAVGVTQGHAELRAFVEVQLSLLKPVSSVSAERA